MTHRTPPSARTIAFFASLVVCLTASWPQVGAAQSPGGGVCFTSHGEHIGRIADTFVIHAKPAGQGDAENAAQDARRQHQPVGAVGPAILGARRAPRRGSEPESQDRRHRTDDPVRPLRSVLAGHAASERIDPRNGCALYAQPAACLPEQELFGAVFSNAGAACRDRRREYAAPAPRSSAVPAQVPWQAIAPDARPQISQRGIFVSAGLRPTARRRGLGRGTRARHPTRRRTA